MKQVDLGSGRQGASPLCAVVLVLCGVAQLGRSSCCLLIKPVGLAAGAFDQTVDFFFAAKLISYWAANEDLLVGSAWKPVS